MGKLHIRVRDQVYAEKVLYHSRCLAHVLVEGIAVGHPVAYEWIRAGDEQVQ